MPVINTLTQPVWRTHLIFHQGMISIRVQSAFLMRARHHLVCARALACARIAHSIIEGKAGGILIHHSFFPYAIQSPTHTRFSPQNHLLNAKKSGADMLYEPDFKIMLKM